VVGGGSIERLLFHAMFSHILSKVMSGSFGLLATLPNKQILTCGYNERCCDWQQTWSFWFDKCLHKALFR